MLTQNRDREEMLTGVMGLVWRHAMRTSRPRSISADELAQVAMLDLCRKVDSYDPAGGQWEWYASATARLVMQRYVIQHQSVITTPSGSRVSERLKDLRRKARKLATFTTRTGDEHHAHEPADRFSWERLDDQLDGADLLRIAREVLGDLEYEVLRLKLEGWTFREIGEQVGITPDYAYVMWKRALEKVKRKSNGSLVRETPAGVTDASK